MTKVPARTVVKDLPEVQNEDEPDTDNGVVMITVNRGNNIKIVLKLPRHAYEVVLINVALMMINVNSFEPFQII